MAECLVALAYRWRGCWLMIELVAGDELSFWDPFLMPMVLGLYFRGSGKCLDQSRPRGHLLVAYQKELIGRWL